MVLQTDIVAVQRVYYNQTYNFSCESGDRMRFLSRRLKQSPHDRSVDGSDEYPVGMSPVHAWEKAGLTLWRRSGSLSVVSHVDSSCSRHP